MNSLSNAHVFHTKKIDLALTVEEVSQALSKPDVSEDNLEEVEAGIDLERWDDTSDTWTIDITENTHKVWKPLFYHLTCI